MLTPEMKDLAGRLVELIVEDQQRAYVAICEEGCRDQPQVTEDDVRGVVADIVVAAGMAIEDL